MESKMKYRCLLAALIVIVLSVSSIVTAGVISIGSLTSNDDGSTQIIKDSLNKREWLRWDVLANLNYAQTLAATTVGSYQGWEIANEMDAELFVKALTGTTFDFSVLPEQIRIHDSYTGPDYSSTQMTALLGDSFIRGGGERDIAWFRQNNDADTPISMHFLLVRDTAFMGAGSSSMSLDENYAGTSSVGIPWLMYKTTDIPEPSTLAIFALGLMGLMSRRFKTKNLQGINNEV